MKPSNHRRTQSGFTLIEVMVVVAILGILAAIVIPRIMDRPDEARVIKARQDIRAMESALQLYRLDNFTYPTPIRACRRWSASQPAPPSPRTGSRAVTWKDCPRIPGATSTSIFRPAFTGKWTSFPMARMAAPRAKGSIATSATGASTERTR